MDRSQSRQARPCGYARQGVETRRGRKQRGATLVEFTLAGIGSFFLLLGAFELSRAMWNYHTLAYAVHEATRYAAVHGEGCTKPGNACSITVGDVARRLASRGLGIPADQANAKLATESGAQVNCAPIQACYGNTAVWPPAANHDNRAGRKITVSVTYRFSGPLIMFWPGAGSSSISPFTLPASSTRTIVF